MGFIFPQKIIDLESRVIAITYVASKQKLGYIAAHHSESLSGLAGLFHSLWIQKSYTSLWNPEPSLGAKPV